MLGLGLGLKARIFDLALSFEAQVLDFAARCPGVAT